MFQVSKLTLISAINLRVLKKYISLLNMIFFFPLLLGVKPTKHQKKQLKKKVLKQTIQNVLPNAKN